MMNLSRKENGFPFSQINITNLVDVALTLVIILLMIAPIIERGIEVKLPVSSPGKIKVEDSLIVTVATSNRYYIGEKQVTLRELYKILKEKKQEKEEVSVVVKGDRTVSYKNIVKVLDIAKKCEINLIGLATQEE
jgi:biopolymer transport protein TolR